MNFKLVEQLTASDVTFVVLDDRDIGVRIGDQVFTSYKGETLKRNNPAFRPILGREFGESLTVSPDPLNLNNGEETWVRDLNEVPRVYFVVIETQSPMQRCRYLSVMGRDRFGNGYLQDILVDRTTWKIPAMTVSTFPTAEQAKEMVVNAIKTPEPDVTVHYLSFELNENLNEEENFNAGFAREVSRYFDIEVEPN